ncbi:MAG: hypothetical protein V2A73_08005 [Pseudomonadota bacterium]
MLLPTAVDGICGGVAATRVWVGRRQPVRRLTGRRAASVEARFLGLLGCSVHRDTGEHAAGHLLGVLYLLLNQKGEQGPVIRLELLVCDPAPELLELLQGDIFEAFLRRAGICPRQLLRHRAN